MSKGLDKEKKMQAKGSLTIKVRKNRIKNPKTVDDAFSNCFRNFM